MPKIGLALMSMQDTPSMEMARPRRRSNHWFVTFCEKGDTMPFAHDLIIKNATGSR